MTRDDLAPIGQDDPGFPCPKCSGAGRILRWSDDEDGGITCTSFNCPACGGSGYGPPPPALDRLRSHCLERLSKWAQRNLPSPEERE